MNHTKTAAIAGFFYVVTGLPLDVYVQEDPWGHLLEDLRTHSGVRDSFEEGAEYALRMGKNLWKIEHDGKKITNTRLVLIVDFREDIVALLV